MHMVLTMHDDHISACITCFKVTSIQGDQTNNTTAAAPKIIQSLNLILNLNPCMTKACIGPVRYILSTGQSAVFKGLVNHNRSATLPHTITSSQPRLRELNPNPSCHVTLQVRN